MIKHYRDYYWNEGIPYGLDPLENGQALEGHTYKIIMDPYRKRISIEKYALGRFVTTIYDSALLNFRHINPMEQQSWQKELLNESKESMECLIRNQDDRILFIETYFFEKNLCRKCLARSPQGILLSIQQMRYTLLGDEENSVTLFDANDHPVIRKIYEADPIQGEFTTLVKEIANFTIENVERNGRH